MGLTQEEEKYFEEHNLNNSFSKSKSSDYYKSGGSLEDSIEN